jgi:hypothetical protein
MALRATGLGLLALAACQSPAPGVADLPTALAPLAIPVQTSAPLAPDAQACWTQTTLPAVIETRIRQAQTAADSFTSTAQARMIQDRTQVWFQVPCPQLATPDFWA